MIRIREAVMWFLITLFTAAGLAYAPVAFAQVPAAQGIDAKFIAILNGLIPVISSLNGLGLIVKFMPIKFLGFVNNHLIPVAQTLVAFFFVLGGGAAVAHASVFGDIGAQLSVLGKGAASLLIMFATRQLHEALVRPLVEKGLQWGNNEALVGRA